MKFAPLPPLRVLALGSLVISLAPKSTRGESALRYKYQDYQEMGGRIAVKVNSAGVEQDLGTATHLKLEGIIDAITGATPNGQPAPTGSDQVPLSQLHERRKAWDGVLSHQFGGVNVAAGVSNSRESDYVSTGWSLNTLFDFNQKNTTLLAGLAGADDDIKVFYQVPRVQKHTHDVIVGVSQLLNPRTSVTLNVTWGRQRGYLSDPYKLVQKNTEIISGVFLPLTFGENRPAERDKWIVFAGLNRSFPEAHGTIDLSYRFYHDTNSTDAHTIDAAWFQRLGEHLMLRPGIRFYDQSAANFYHYRLDGTSVVPVSGAPRPNGPFYSSDYRLSAMQTVNYGAKLIWKMNDALQFDVALERYEMRGTDGVTPQSAYCRAKIISVGGRFSW